MCDTPSRIFLNDHLFLHNGIFNYVQGHLTCNDLFLMAWVQQTLTREEVNQRSVAQKPPQQYWKIAGSPNSERLYCRNDEFLKDWVGCTWVQQALATQVPKSTVRSSSLSGNKRETCQTKLTKVCEGKRQNPLKGPAHSGRQKRNTDQSR